MSRSPRPPHQGTLNYWVNTEAVAAYASNLDDRATRIEDHAWFDGPNRAEAQAIAALREAAAAIRAANDMAQRAARLDDAVACAYTYGWDHGHPRHVFGADAEPAAARQPFENSPPVI
jgi:hypothetical protein